MPSTHTAIVTMTQKINPPLCATMTRTGLAEGEHTSVQTTFRVQVGGRVVISGRYSKRGSLLSLIA